MTKAFVWVNGLNPVILIEWVELMHLTQNTGHIKPLFVYFDQGDTLGHCMHIVRVKICMST